MKRNRLFKLDYSMLSSYLGRWSTVLIFTVIILIAGGALFIEEDDIAHMPVEIGVYDLDSTVVHRRLEDLARFVRGKGGGDIGWTYMRDRDDPEGCDFYLMSSLRFASHLDGGELDCSLIVAMAEGRRYSSGVVITRAGKESDAGRGNGAVFTSPFSAAGFLSPYRAIVSSGIDLSPDNARIDFAGTEERVLFGVLFGAYEFGGISLERLNYLEERGMIGKNEIEIVMRGESYPEMVLASGRGGDPRKLSRFTGRFLLLADRLPLGLKRDLYCIGLSGFAEPRPTDIEVMSSLVDMVPSWAKSDGSEAPGI
jgi:hypothetical protein